MKTSLTSAPLAGAFRQRRAFGGSSARGSKRGLVGLEIDSTAATAASLGSGSLVSTTGTVAIAPGIVRSGEVADPEALGHALRELWDAHPGLSRSVRVGVANPSIVIRMVDLPPLEDNDRLEKAVLFAAEDVLPMDLSAVTLDYRLLGLVKTADGPRHRALIVAARREMIDSVVAATRAADLQIKGIDLSAFAMVRAVQRGDVRPAVYVNLGGMTNMAVAHDEVCTFARVSDSGMAAMTTDFAEAVGGMSDDSASQWLHYIGLSQPTETLEGDPALITQGRQILEAGFRGLAMEIRATVDYHAQADPDAPLTEVLVLTGAGTTLPGASEFLADELDVNVETRSVELANGVRVSGPHVTVAAGLAMEHA